jgi:hypothetical protein
MGFHFVRQQLELWPNAGVARSDFRIIVSHLPLQTNLGVQVVTLW